MQPARRRKQHHAKTRQPGTTLVEILVTIGVLATAGLLVEGIFRNGYEALVNARARVTAIAIANEKLEIMRTMPYDTVGTTTGWPSGVLPSDETIQRSNVSFTIHQRVDYIDDPFDGLMQNQPPATVDTAPNDYKRAEITVRWGSFLTPVLISTYIVPRNLEAATNTGSFIIRVFDASGIGVPQATVRIENPGILPSPIVNTTDNDGNLQIIGLPPSIGNYNLQVSKTGYSTERTYDPNQQPNPTRPNLSIIANQVTQTSFAIDQVSTLNVATRGENCSAIGNVPLSLYGEKLIATNPDVRKYSSSPPTAGDGTLALNNLEWDNYTLIETSPDYDVAGVIPPILLNILPNTAQSIALVLAPSSPNSLRVTAKNAANGTTITGASAHLTGTGYDETKVTGVGYFSQTDWSGGSGQATFADPTMYHSDDGQIDATATPGLIELNQVISQPVVSESFSSTALRDASATTADWDTSGSLRLAQSAGAYLNSGVAQSIKLNPGAGKITQATLSSTADPNGQTIVYELSADGGQTFETVAPDVEHTFAAAGSDLRFRLSLATANPAVSPTVDGLVITARMITYDSSGTLTSSTFDTNDLTTDPTNLNWQPVSQVPETGADSLRFQVAANTDNATWSYVGPDGTDQTFFTVSGTDLPAGLTGQRYFRYRVYLQTADPSITPSVDFVSLGFTSGCVPPGQTFFASLNSATYALTVTAPGLQDYTSNVTVNGATAIDVLMSP